MEKIIRNFLNIFDLASHNRSQISHDMKVGVSCWDVMCCDCMCNSTTCKQQFWRTDQWCWSSSLSRSYITAFIGLKQLQLCQDKHGDESSRNGNLWLRKCLKMLVLRLCEGGIKSEYWKSFLLFWDTKSIFWESLILLSSHWPKWASIGSQNAPKVFKKKWKEKKKRLIILRSLVERFVFALQSSHFFAFFQQSFWSWQGILVGGAGWGLAPEQEVRVQECLLLQLSLRQWGQPCFMELVPHRALCLRP